jgi:hypothetical protein
MKKSGLAILLVLFLLGSMLVFFPNVSACHKFIVTCVPTEKDIFDNITWNVTYDITVELRPGCGSEYYVGFSVSTAGPGFHMNLYEKGDLAKKSRSGSGEPSDGDHNNWDGWILAGPGNPVYYYAVLEVSCDPNTENDSNTTIYVNAWSTDNNNDLYNRKIITKTTVNIPNGIIYHTNPSKSIQEVKPGESAEFEITVKDINGEAYGQIDLYKSAKSSPSFDDDWEWTLPNNVTIEQPNETAKFTLKVKPPSDAGDGDLAYFFIYGENRDNSNYNHIIWAKTIVAEPKPDLSCKNEVGIININLLGEEYSDGETYNLSIDVYNLGEIEVSDFIVAFKMTIVGGGRITFGTKTVNETVAPGKYVNVQHEWLAAEGIQWLSVVLDPAKSITEVDEVSNNGCGLWAEVGPPLQPENIVLEMAIEPMNVMQNREFTVSGKAKYDPRYNNLPLNNSDVEVKIQETNVKFKSKTYNDGRYEIKCASPENEGTYTIIVNCTDGNLIVTKIGYIRVTTFQVAATILSSSILAGKNISIAGNATDLTFAVKDANVTVNLFNEDNNDVLLELATTNTDQNGMFNVTIAIPKASEVIEYTIIINASQRAIFGIQIIKILADIDTDDDGLYNNEDPDDDNDGLSDIDEHAIGTDPLLMDTDGDGVGDKSDDYPNDSTKWKKEEDREIDLIILGVVIAIVIVIIIVIFIRAKAKRKR